MYQIDAATALRILVKAASADTAEPTLEAMTRIEEDARSGRMQLWGFKGHAPTPEPIPVEHICALDFYWLARASKVDDQLGELDLVAGRGGEPVWRNVRFYRCDIEGAKPVSPQKTRMRRKRDLAMQAAKELWAPDGLPPSHLTDDAVQGDIVAHLQKQGVKDKDLPGKDSSLRATGRRI
jgi:hypothetical protein